MVSCPTSLSLTLHQTCSAQVYLAIRGRRGTSAFCLGPDGGWVKGNSVKVTANSKGDKVEIARSQDLAKWRIR